MKELYFITPEYLEGEEFLGGIGNFSKELINEFTKSKKIKTTVITLGFKKDLEVSEVKSLTIVRLVNKFTKNINNLSECHDDSIIFTKIFKIFGIQLHNFFRKIKNSENKTIIFNGYEATYKIDLLKKLGFRTIFIMHTFFGGRLLREINSYYSNDLYFKLSLKKKILQKILKIFNLKNDIQFFKISENISTNYFTKKMNPFSSFCYTSELKGILYSDIVVVPSENMKNHIKLVYSKDFTNKIEKISWGTNIRRLESNTLKESIINEYNIGNNDFVILSISRIEPLKGIDYIIEALKIIDGKNLPKKIVVFICGSYISQDKSYFTALETESKKLKNIRIYFPGFVSDKLKLSYYNIPNIFINPSISETFGLTTLEALSAGKPVICLDTSGSLDIVSEDVGIILSHSNGSISQKLSDAIIYMMLNSDKFDKERIIKHAKKFNWKKTFEMFEDII